MSDWGLKIALPGYDVDTATPEQCAVHTGFDTFKVRRDADPEHFGVVRVTFVTEPTNGTTTNVVTKAHGFTYRPTCLAHLESSTQIAVAGEFDLDVALETYFLCYTTTTNFIIDFTKGTTFPPTMLGRVYNIRYYVFVND